MPILYQFALNQLVSVEQSPTLIRLQYFTRLRAVAPGDDLVAIEGTWKPKTEARESARHTQQTGILPRVIIIVANYRSDSDKILYYD